MFGRKSKQSEGSSNKDNMDGGRKNRKGAELMNQMGFGGMEDMEAMVYGDDDDDGDLEAELAALTGETNQVVQRTKRKAPLPMSDIENLVAMGMNDVDEDVSDTEDPDLLAELQDLAEEDSPSPSKTPNVSSNLQTSPQKQPPIPVPRMSPSPQKESHVTQSIARPSPQAIPSPTTQTSSPMSMVSILEERISMYKQASSNAKTAGDSSKARRLDRGLKTLASQLRLANSGKPINEEEIPPPVAISSTLSRQPKTSEVPSSVQSVSPAASLSATSPQVENSLSPGPAPSIDQKTNTAKSTLEERRDRYRRAALQAKHEGNIERARDLVKVAKQFDAVIDAIDQGKSVDLSKMPPPPAEFLNSLTTTVHQPQAVSVQREARQAAGDSPAPEPEPDYGSTTAEEEKTMFQAPEAPTTVMEALTQRLDKYKTSETAAKTAGEGSKARRMGRIVKQYQDAIKQYKAGRPVDFDELPCPPGFGPIPKEQAPPIASLQPSPVQKSAGPPSASPKPQPVSPQSVAVPPQHKALSTPPSAAQKPQIQRQASSRKSLGSRSEQQLAFLRERLGEFKQAALNAKKNHDLELAKKYVRMMKGLEPMIEALESGLPVDLSQVPPSPIDSEDAEDKFVVVSVEDCQPTGDRETVCKKLQMDLIRQIQVCVTNAQHYQKLGDVPAAAKFQKLEQNNRRDLDSLKSAFRHGDPAPRFHYETKTFSMVQSNTDLGDGDLELSVIRGIQLPIPSGYSIKDMDTHIKYEFAYPSDEVQSGDTGTKKDTSDPEYNEKFKMFINRKSKGLYRFIERKSLKLEVFMYRGFFKSEKLLGTVNVKLQPLESKCTLHDSYDLMDGRKSVGGKLEVKIRIRDPFKNKQVDEVKEKWLVIDQFIRTVGSKSQTEAKAAPKAQGEGTICMEVLRFEKAILDKQIIQLKDSLSVTQTQALRHKSALIDEKIELQQKKLREGGMDAWKAYLNAVKNESVRLEQNARQFLKTGEMQKAELMMNKKKYADKEISAIKSKIPDA